MVYANDTKAADALQQYFSKYHFENGGYHLKWFKIKIGPVYIALPNTKGRIAAVKIHDLHHLVTEFPATIKGEALIGAWEIASGCGKYLPAWFLNTGSFYYGMFFFPRSLFKAFLRGRRCGTNLYHDVDYNAELLSKTVGELRYEIEIKNARENVTTDYLYFAALGLFLLAFSLCSLYLVCRLAD